MLRRSLATRSRRSIRRRLIARAGLDESIFRRTGTTIGAASILLYFHGLTLCDFFGSLHVQKTTALHSSSIDLYNGRQGRKTRNLEVDQIVHYMCVVSEALVSHALNCNSNLIYNRSQKWHVEPQLLASSRMRYWSVRPSSPPLSSQQST